MEVCQYNHFNCKHFLLQRHAVQLVHSATAGTVSTTSAINFMPMSLMQKSPRPSVSRMIQTAVSCWSTRTMPTTLLYIQQVSSFTDILHISLRARVLRNRDDRDSFKFHIKRAYIQISPFFFTWILIYCFNLNFLCFCRRLNKMRGFI